VSYAYKRDSSRRLTGLVAVVAFHVLLVYALVQASLARSSRWSATARDERSSRKSSRRRPTSHPPPPPPRLAMPPPPYIPPPEVQVQVPVVMAPTITAVTPLKPREYRTRRRAVDIKSCEPRNPAAARRANETGTVRLA